MGSNLSYLRLRIHGQGEKELKQLHRALLWDMERKGKKPLSFNAFLIHCLLVYEDTPEGSLLRDVYNRELFEKEKKERNGAMVNKEPIEEEGWI